MTPTHHQTNIQNSTRQPTKKNHHTKQSGEGGRKTCVQLVKEERTNLFFGTSFILLLLVQNRCGTPKHTGATIQNQ